MAAVTSPNLGALPDPVDTTQQEVIIDFSITLSGNYGVANGHGDVLDLGNCSGGQAQLNNSPNRVEIYEAPTAGNAPTGYVLGYSFGPDQHTGKLTVMQNQGAGNPNLEITQGNAYPAALTAATANIRGRAWFPKFL